MVDKNVFKQLEEQKTIINFLQEKYKQDTGCEIVLPQSWTNFLGTLIVHRTNSKSHLKGTTEKNTPIQDLQEIDLEKEKQKEYTVAKKKDDDSFVYALAALNLPQKKVDGKKGAGGMTSPMGGAGRGPKSKNLTTTFNPANPAHMVEVINLSNFAGRVRRSFYKFSLLINLFRNSTEQVSEN